MPGESQQTPASAPDPTVYVQEAIDRASKAEREWVAAQLAVRDQRLRDIDKATELLNETVNRVPTDVTKEILHLKELTNQLIAGRDALVALQTECSDKATTKAEAGFTKQIDALTTLVDKSIDSLSDRINDNKTRIDRIESGQLGILAQRTETRSQGSDNRQLMASITGVIIFVIIVAGFVIALATKSPA